MQEVSTLQCNSLSEPSVSNLNSVSTNVQKVVNNLSEDSGELSLLTIGKNNIIFYLKN